MACPAPAQLSAVSSSAFVVVAAASEPASVAVHLVMPADFVTVPIRVYSDQKDTALAYEETSQALDVISQKAKDNGEFRVLNGEISLSQRQSGGWGLSSGSWGSEPAGAAEIYLLVPFAAGHTNIFEAGAEAARFVETLDLPGKAHFELGRLQLAVENPEQYRDKLLHAIADEIKKTCQDLVQFNVRVDGLEKPVMVRQTDDRNVELYLDYSLSVRTAK